MHHLLILWIDIIYLSVAYRTSSNSFPYDLMAESSDNVAPKVTDKTKNDDEKRTLSQQVAEGKYGLIHKELFSKPFRRPGVISYNSNNEVPKDTELNFGGLNKSDIWLAENHLLVIKGGYYPTADTLPEYSKSEWIPIDDYNAPRRQVKIPKNPKVPPPFPVQLTDGGPLQILGTNYTRNINDTYFPSKYPVPPLEGFEPGSGPYYPPEYLYPPDTAPGKPPFPGSLNPSPISGNNERNPVITSGSILPPFFDALPPGAAVLPPPNITDQNDEDDLSIYYPPPYSFYYPVDNTTQVPPGPLVPGIVLPPPPDFFGMLQPPSTTTTMRPTLPTKSPQRTKPGSVTVLRPVKTKPSPIYIYDNHIPHQPFPEYGPPPRNKVSVTATKVPLRAYFTTQSKPGYVTAKRPEQHFYYYDPNAPETNAIPAQYPTLTKDYVNNTNSYILKPHYYYVQSPINNFKAHIIKLEEQLRSYDKPPQQFQQNPYKKPVPKPVYQYSFEAANYKEQHNKLQGNTRPKYTVQIEPAIEITTSAPPTYYQPHYDYETTRAITPNPNRYRATANPLYSIPYTKQDDKLLDDITKTYFTTFGKRIKVTTPLPILQYSITKPKVNVETIKAINIQNQHYKTRPNLETFIPTNVETIQSVGIPSQSYQTIQEINGQNQQYPQYSPHAPEVETLQAINIPSNQQYVPIRQQKGNIQNPYLHIIKPPTENIDTVSISTKQNPYVQIQKQPNVQTIQAIAIEPNNKPGSFISYQLPGDDGAHFYFLTPQLAQNTDSQHIGYYYPHPSAARLARRS